MLRLIEKVDNVVSFDGAAAVAEARNVLEAEAAELEAAHGKNAYSEFLIKHGHRPDPRQAATIGRLIGMRIKASDGSMQPRRTKSERDALRQARAERNEIYRTWDYIGRLRTALANLALIDGDPATLVREIASCDRPEIGRNLKNSLEWLSRFAAEWHGHGEEISDKTALANSRGVFRAEEIWIETSNDP